ncbi:GIY-YIG nuclease family protein [Candidatus Uhrbacteria bacterium]|nr:GIY-YIG nuclease family protein [Candidatus Uhrbacteria bacterium]
MKRWYVYILRCHDGSLYTGISTNVAERVTKHNAGKGAAYTRSHKPVTLIWSKPSKTPTAARKREAKIKSWSKQEKEQFIKKVY